MPSSFPWLSPKDHRGIGPSGKSGNLRFDVIRVCLVLLKKIFRFFRIKIRRMVRSSHPGKRGVSRSSRTRGGMRWTRACRWRTALLADGEVVWSWRPDAGAKSSGSIRFMTGARKPGPRGEREISRKTTAQGRPGCSRLYLYARVRFLFSARAHETAGASRHPAFPAPSSSKGARKQPWLGRIPPRECPRTSAV